METTGAELHLRETGLPLRKYAYSWVKGRYSHNILCAIACVKIAQWSAALCHFLFIFVVNISKRKRLAARQNMGEIFDY